MAANGKVIVTCAVTGAIHTPTMSDHLPLTPDEIADQAVGAAEAGRRSCTSTPATPATAARPPTRRCSWSSCRASSRAPTPWST